MRAHQHGGLTSAQRAALQYPYIIGVLLLIGGRSSSARWRIWVDHADSRARKPVRQLFAQVGQALTRPVRGALGMPELAPQGGLLRDEQAIMQHAINLIQKFDIRTPGPDIDGGNLSGGNQQKMIVAREFSRKPRLLIAAQPTRGIDVGSIEFIHSQIIEQRDAGAAVLLVSAELDEIMALSDRIAVLYKGEIIDTLPAQRRHPRAVGSADGGDQKLASPAFTPPPAPSPATWRGASDPAAGKSSLSHGEGTSGLSGSPRRII